MTRGARAPTARSRRPRRRSSRRWARAAAAPRRRSTRREARAWPPRSLHRRLISRRCFSAASSILTAGPSSCARSPRPPRCFSCSSLCSRRSASSFSESSACAASLRASCCRAATVWSRSFASSVRADASAFCCAAPSFTAPPSCLRSAATRVGGRRPEEPAAPRRRLEPAPRRSAALLHRAHRHLQPLLRVDQVLDALRRLGEEGGLLGELRLRLLERVGCVDGHRGLFERAGRRREEEDHRVLRHRAPGWLTPRNCSAAARICGPNSPWCAGAAVAAHPTQPPPTARAGEVSAFQDRPPPRRAALRLRLCAARKFFALSRRRALPSAGSALLLRNPGVDEELRMLMLRQLGKTTALKQLASEDVSHITPTRASTSSRCRWAAAS